MESRRVLTRCLSGMMWLAAGMFVPAACAQPSAPAAVPWVDVHMHLIGGRGQQQDYAGAVNAAMREMERFGVAMAIVLPPPQVDQQQVYDAYALVGALQRHRHRFAYLGGGGVLNSTIHRYADPAGVTDAVRRDFAAAADQIIHSGAVGFGEMASLHLSAATGHPYEFVPADHSLRRVLADLAAKRDVAIDLHMDAVKHGGMSHEQMVKMAVNCPTSVGADGPPRS